MQEPTKKTDTATSSVEIIVDVAHPEGLPPVSSELPDSKEWTDDRKSPWKWALLKGDLKPEDRLHVPWRFHQAIHFNKWPAPDLVPDFAISESEYDDGMKHVSIY